MCLCKSLSSDVEVMGPRRKASKLQPVGGSSGGELVLSPSEPKDYINELSHEVLCHIFRYTNYKTSDRQQMSIISQCVCIYIYI